MFGRLNRQKIFIVLLTICLVFSGIDPVFAVPEGTDGSEVTISENESVSDGSMSENDTEDDITEETEDIISEDAAGDTNDYETGYIPVPMEVPETYYAENEGEEAAGAELPDFYLPDINTAITSVKNQGSEGFCWAYSSCAVLEQSAIKTGIGNLSTNYNEHQLNEGFTSNHKNDPLNLTSGDWSTKTVDGNNNLFTTWLLASQVSPVDENMSQSSGYDSRSASLVEAKFIRSDDLTAIKQAILDYGAVTIAIDSTNYNGTNKLTYGYRAASHYGENHAVTLIGWDDHIEKNQFGDKNGDKYASASYNSCPVNGGFKFKNSWGTGVGEYGYQYISYADHAFRGNDAYAIAYKIDRPTSFDTVYEYDGSYGIQYETVTRAANFYNACANTSNGGVEDITRAGFGVMTTGEYDISVYVNYNDEALTQATSGQWFMKDENLVATKRVVVSNSGYYTADFDNPCMIEEGMEFAVVLKKADNEEFTMYVDETYNNSNWISFHANTENEKTFAQRNFTWKNTSYFTPRLKVFTKNISTIAPVHTVLNNANVALRKSSYAYTGSEIRPAVIVKDQNGTVIPMNGNYTLTYSSNTDIGKGKVTVTGVDNSLCSGSKELYFDIEPADLSYAISYYYSGNWIETEIENKIYSVDPVYTKEMISKYIKLALNGKDLVRGTDYYVEDGDSIIESVEDGKIVLTGKGNFKGSRYVWAKSNQSTISISGRKTASFPDGSYYIFQVNDSDVEIEYTGDLPVVTDLKLKHTSRGDLVPGVDYTIINNNTTIKDANSSFTVTASGKGFYSGNKNVWVYILPASVSECQVSNITEKTYTGSAITQDNIVVKVNGRRLIKDIDYTLDYSGNINAGNNAKITIRGTGNYIDEKTIAFTIKKAAPVLTNLSATDIESGQRLRDSVLSGTARCGNVTVPGTFSFDSYMTEPAVGTAEYAVTFTPDDENNYEKAYGRVSVTVTEKDDSLIFPGVSEQTYKAGRKLSDITIHNPMGNPDGTWNWKEPDTLLKAPGGRYVAVFTYEDGSHPDKETYITIRVNKASVTLSSLLATPLRYGQWLNSSLVTGIAKSGDDEVAGSFRFEDPSITPELSDSNSTLYDVVFTPEDTDNYNTGSGKVTVTVTEQEPDPVNPDPIPDPVPPGPEPDPVNPTDPEITEPEPEPEPETEEPPEPEEFDGKIKSLSIINENLKKVKTLKLVKGETAFLIADVVMARGEKPDAHFRSTNTNVVRVTDNGKVSGFGQGSADITVYCGDKTAKCTVTVTEDIQDVSLNIQKDKMTVGEKIVIRPEIYPLSSAADRSVNWLVDNKKLASVAGGPEGCVLTAKSSGSVTVTAKIKTTDPHGQKKTLTRSCAVKIETPILEPVSSADKSYKLGFRNKTVRIDGIGNQNTVTAVLSDPSKADSVSIDWISSNEDVVKIMQADRTASASGKKAFAGATVSGCGVGYAFITVKVRDNESGLVNVNRCKITVNAPVKIIDIYGDSLNLYDAGVIQLRKGQKDRLFVDVYPYSPTNINKISWSAKGGVTVKNGVIYASKVTSSPSSVTVKCGNIKKTIKIFITK